MKFKQISNISKPLTKGITTLCEVYSVKGLFFSLLYEHDMSKERTVKKFRNKLDFNFTRTPPAVCGQNGGEGTSNILAIIVQIVSFHKAVWNASFQKTLSTVELLEYFNINTV